MPQKLIGRQAELDRLMKEVGHGAQPATTPPVTCVVGPRSIGKSTFLDAAWQRFVDLQIPAVCVRLPVPAEDGGVRAWLESITPVLRASHPALQARLTQFRHAFNQRLARLDHGTNIPFASDRLEAEIAEWWTRELHRFITERDDADTDTDELPSQVRMLWFVDDFEHWTSPLERWLNEWMGPVMAEFNEVCATHFFACLEKLPAETASFADVWLGLAESGETIELKPFTREEVAGFIEEASITGLDVDCLWQDTQGNPGKLQAILNQRRSEQVESDVDHVEGIFKGKNEEEIGWMLWAAHVRWFNRDFLRFFSGKAEGDAAFAYLKLRLELGLSPINGGFQVSVEVAEALRAWHEIRRPEDFEHLHQRARICTDLFQMVGSGSDLEVLSLLSRFRFFNHKLVEKLLPGDSRTIRAFTQDNPEYFFETDSNVAVADSFRGQFREYNALVPHPQERELSRKIRTAWEECRDCVLREMHEVEEQIKRDEKTLDEISTELGTMKKDDRVRRYDEKAEQAPKVKVQFSHDNKSGGAFTGLCVAGFFATVLGIFFLYMGILFTDQFSMTYCALGVMFVGGGLTLPQTRRPKPRKVTMTAVKTKAAPKPKPPSDSNQRLLNMKLTNLENKRSLTIESLSRQRQRFAELDTILCEPYVD